MLSVQSLAVEMHCYPENHELLISTTENTAQNSWDVSQESATSGF